MHSKAASGEFGLVSDRQRSPGTWFIVSCPGSHFSFSVLIASTCIRSSATGQTIFSRGENQSRVFVAQRQPGYEVRLHFYLRLTGIILGEGSRLHLARLELNLTKCSPVFCSSVENCVPSQGTITGVLFDEVAV